MGSKENKFVDKTILNTPQPTATSTVEKKKSHKRIPSEFKKSLSIVSIDELSRISEDRYESNASYHLQEQRSLAESSLLRANNIVAGIPSRYFIPNTTKQKTSLNISENSTVNESDLLRTPADSSTPRSSIGRTSLSQSVAQLSHKIKNTDISIDNFVEEFQKAMKSGSNQEVDSLIFKPAEEAASMLLADELSWRRQNELPIIEEGFSEANVSAKTSIGEFFRQRSDTLSVLGAVSPTKTHNPMPLIDESLINKSDFGEEPKKKNKSLSISAIQKCLQSDDTPRKAADLLLKQSNEYDFSRYLLEKKMEKVSPSMSKDSSCTSDPSDELLKCIFDKENVDTLNTSIPKNRPGSSGSPNSRSSSRALTSLPDGKLPIESTASELIWGCVKIDKCVTQEFSIRNKSAKRLCIQMAVTGHDYKIRKDNRFEADLLSSTKVILHPFESKIIIVSFVPTRVGACVDSLSFSPVDSKMQQTKKQSVKLFGYGGYDKIEFNNLTKDTTGKYWMSLGKLDNQGELCKTFSVVNTGVLPSFVYMAVNSRTYSQMTVEPNFFVLIANEQKEITVKNVFNTYSYKIFQKTLSNSSVFDLGNLNIVTGTEANRGRLRRLCRKLDSGSIDSLSNILKENINGEVMPSDMQRFKESPSSFKNILDLFNKYEVVLTLERDPDLTILLECPDESAMYHTLCEETVLSVMENTVAPMFCRLEPSTVILTPPTKVKDFLFLISETDRPFQYQVHCDSEGLEVSPIQGILNPGQEITIFLNYPLCLPNLKCFKVTVNVGNETCESLVKIKSLL